VRSKLALSALVVASLFGSTVIASAQTQPAAGASSEGNVGPTKDGKKGKLETKGMAMDSVSKDGMSKDTMSKDSMSKDGMKKDGMTK
jgi:pentapeptide MXKDX repeat protein